jgi:uncharacterized protein YjiS (DUF1127 family)
LYQYKSEEAVMPRAQTQFLPFRAFAGLARRVVTGFEAAIVRRHERLLLARLDDHLLRDIGLSPDEAKVECAKPIWRD